MALNRYIPKVASVFTVLCGGVVLFGWAFDIESLKSLFPGLATMKPNTAASFLFSGISLWLLQGHQEPTSGHYYRQESGQIFALIVALSGLLTLSEDIFGWNLGIDQILFRDNGATASTDYPGRMAIATALNFSLLGCSLLLVKVKTRFVRLSGQMLTHIVIFISLLALVGYAYGVQSLYKVSPFSSVALHTAITFLTLSIGILFINTDRGIAAIVLSEGPGGVLSRRLIPAIFIIPFTVGWLRLEAQHAGYFENRFGVALFALTNIALFSVLTSWTARSLNRADEERKRAEDENFKLASIVEYSDDAIFAKTLDNIITSWNKGAERIYGYKPKEIIGLPVSILIPPDLADEAQQIIEKIRNDERVEHFETVRVRKDGESIYVSLTISPIKDAAGRIVGASSVARDITARQRMEDALRQGEERLQIVTENMSEALVISDLDGQLIHWNRAGMEMHGFKDLGEWLLRIPDFEKFYELSTLDGAVLSPEQWPLARVIRGENVRNFEVRAGRLDLEWERVFSYSGTIVHESNGRPLAFVTITDITERKRAEEAVRRLNEELEQRVNERTAQLQSVNRELEAFSYSVSHDLRAPLRHINGFSTALLEDYQDSIDETGRSYLRELCGASKEMAQLIDDLLQLSRVTRSDMQCETVHLTEMACGVIDELKRMEPERIVQFETEEDLTAYGDRRLLKVLLTNLLGNAWKFTSKREAPEIRFGQEIREQENVYFVRDNGAGFDMTYADKLFGAFQRLHSPREFEGTGIGLATVHRIILRHGGRVWARGKVNEGASFYFTLPEVKEEQEWKAR